MNINSLITLLMDTVIDYYDTVHIIYYCLLGVMALCALFVIVVVLLQPGQSSGLGALGGTTDTFYGKNKGKSIQSKLKKATTACFIIMAILCIAFFVLKLVLSSMG